MNITRIPELFVPPAGAAPDPPPKAPEPANATPPDVEAVLAAANRRLAVQGEQFDFEWDGESRRIVVKLVDSSTREVIRQIPSEEALAIAKRLAALPGRFATEA